MDVLIPNFPCVSEHKILSLPIIVSFICHLCQFLEDIIFIHIKRLLIFVEY